TFSISGPASRPTHPLSTLRDHGRPCTSLRSRKTRFRPGSFRFDRWDFHPWVTFRSFWFATSFVFDQAYPGALAVAVNVHDRAADHVKVNVIHKSAFLCV